MTTPAKLSTVRKIWSLLTPVEQRSAVPLLGLMWIGMGLETLGVSLVIPAIALLTQSAQGDLSRNYPAFQPVLQVLGYPSPQSLVVGGMLVLVGVYFIKALFLALLAWRQTRFAYGVQEQLSQRLFTAYLRQPYTFHLQRNSAQLIRNVTTDVSGFTGGAMIPGMSLLTESMVLFGLCALLLFVEPLGALVAVSVLGITAWGFHRLTRKRIMRWGEARQHHEGLRIQHLQQGLGGAKDVKLLGREADFLEQYRLHNAQSARMGRLQATLQQLPRLWLELLAVSGLAILVISMLAQGRALEAVLPTLGLFAAAAFRLIPSVNRILSAVQSLRYGLSMIDNLHAELNLATPEVVGNSTPVAPFRTALDLSKVSYTYLSASAPAVKDISLTIQRGESVGFIGASGAGKSTLVDILLGLLTPAEGEVRVDGKDIQANLRNWQNQIGYVPQAIYLTDDTLRRNVAFGLPNEQIDDAAIRHAIKAAQLEEFVASLPDGLETFVGERGIRLSGGQRQRIGIARALYHDPAVLVLDEATSSLDTDTERGVMQAVRALHGAKTVIIVAHRFSTIEHCDRLYRLEQGRVEEEGVPSVMLARKVDITTFKPDLIVYDFDGVMTDNRVLVLQDGTEAVLANRADGWGIGQLRQAGYRQIILSTETNPVVSARARKLGLEALQGSGDKLRDLTIFCQSHGIALERVLYVGNDVNDLEAMRLVGCPVAPVDAHASVLSVAKHITHSRGGEGVIKELSELLLAQTNE